MRVKDVIKFETMVGLMLIVQGFSPYVPMWISVCYLFLGSMLICLNLGPRPVEKAFRKRYSGDGLDEAALEFQKTVWPLRDNLEPDHSVQVAIKMLIDDIRKECGIEPGVRR